MRNSIQRFWDVVGVLRSSLVKFFTEGFFRFKSNLLSFGHQVTSLNSAAATSIVFFFSIHDDKFQQMTDKLLDEDEKNLNKLTKAKNVSNALREMRYSE